RLERPSLDRCRLAVRRRDCLRRLCAMDPGLPLDEQDALWVQHWDEPLLEGCADGLPHRARYRLAAERLAAWRELEEALRTRDLERAGAAAANPLLAGYPPRQRREQEVEELVRATAKVERVLGMLRRRSASGFTETDLEFI